MIREYYRFIKEYLNLANLKKKYLTISIVSAFLYKTLYLLLPLIASLIIKYLIIKDTNMTYLYLIIFLITYILYNIVLYINYYVYGYNMSYCYNKLQTRLLNKLISVDNNFNKVMSKGRIMNSINTDVIDVGDMNDRLSELSSGLFQIPAIIVIVGTYNIYIAIIFIIFSYFYINQRNNSDRKVNFYHRKVVKEDDKYSILLTQIISGLQEIKTFNMLKKLKGRLNIIQNKFTNYYANKRKFYTIRDNDIRIITYVFRTILYLLLACLLISKHIELNILILVISYHEYLVSYIDDIITSTVKIRETNTAVNRINDILNYNSENINYGDVELDKIKGIIEFKNVNLTIKKNKILRNINLKINSNEVVAIVGEEGSGKTMMFNLLLRLFKPNSGEITIDKINIYDFTKSIYTSNVSIINQKPFIFNMSIRHNLDFVDEDIENQIEACKKAGIHDFIETLPDGYNTILRENGSNISGGQKQMISIARTILSDAEILLFDDITTSLDPDTAQLVPRLINKLKKDHTIVFITKKPDLMKIADKIVVLDKGKIVAINTHKNLLETNEIYQNLQSRKSPSRIGVFDNV